MTATVNTGKFNTKIVLVLNETVQDPKSTDPKDKIYKKIGEAQLPMPILADFGIDAAIAKDDKGVDEYEDGIPVYADATYDWLMTAISARVAAQARNKFIKGELKDNATLADDFASLTALAGRNGEALKARHDAKKSFVAYLEAANKKPAVVKVLGDLFGDANSIAYAKDNYVNALVSHLPVFVGTLSEVDKTRFTNTLTKISDAIDGRNTSLDDMSADAGVAVAA